MYTGQVAEISNRADWQSDVVELIDEDDGSTVNLADPLLTVAISVYIKGRCGCCGDGYSSHYRCCCTTRVVGTLDNAKVVIVGPGFQWQFEDTDLRCFCAGTYRCGVKITINGFITDLILGELVIREGN